MYLPGIIYMYAMLYTRYEVYTYLSMLYATPETCLCGYLLKKCTADYLLWFGAKQTSRPEIKC